MKNTFTKNCLGHSRQHCAQILLAQDMDSITFDTG